MRKRCFTLRSRRQRKSAGARPVLRSPLGPRHAFCLWTVGLGPRQSEGWHGARGMGGSCGRCPAITSSTPSFFPRYLFLPLRPSLSVVRATVLTSPAWLCTTCLGSTPGPSCEAFLGHLHFPGPCDTHSTSVLSNVAQLVPRRGIQCSLWCHALVLYGFSGFRTALN